MSRPGRRPTMGPGGVAIAMLAALVSVSCGLQSGCAQRVADQLGLQIGGQGQQAAKAEPVERVGADAGQAAKARAREAWVQGWRKLKPQLRTGDLVFWGPETEQLGSESPSKGRRRGIVPVRDIERRAGGLHDFRNIGLLLVDFGTGLEPPARWPELNEAAEGELGHTSETGGAQMPSANPVPVKVEIVTVVAGKVQRLAIEEWQPEPIGGALPRVYGRLPGERPLPEAFRSRLDRYVERFDGRPLDTSLEWDDRALYGAELVWKLWQLAAGENLGQPTAWRLGTAASDELKAVDAARRKVDEVGASGPVITRLELLASGRWRLVTDEEPAVAQAESAGEVAGAPSL